jgi:pimeloyl-ACP methyl ester carboxylesterase
MVNDTTEPVTLALLCGLLCDAQIWQEVMSRLAVAADVRVFSFASFDNIGAMAEHVLNAIPGRFAIAGHSMGGRVALEIVRRDKDRVLAVALLNTGVHPPAPHEADTRGRLVAIAREQGMAELAKHWLPPMLGRADLDAAVVARLTRMVERASPESFAAQVQALLQRPDASQVLPHLPGQTLLLSATQDKWSPPSQHEAMRRLCTDGQLVIVENAGHFALIEEPEAVAAAITDWLRPILAAQRTQSAQPAPASIEETCSRQILRYARLVDEEAYEELAQLFTQEGVFIRPADPDNPRRGRKLILESFKSRPPRRSLHVVYDIKVQVESPSCARATSEVILFSVENTTSSPPAIVKAVGSFTDVLHRVGDDWLFASRQGRITSRSPA